MISILIPIYNYNVKMLLTALTEQVKVLDLVTEIICLDDASTDKKVTKENKELCKTLNIPFFSSPSNNGRTITRQALAEKAKYNWLLFLDSDVLPKEKTFLKDYAKYINHKYDCIYGGICYEKKTPEAQFILRWKYGNEREDTSAKKRNNSPYKSIASGNLLIKKSVFLGINKELDKDWYGYDTLFSARLKSLKKQINHINNKVFHLGLEENNKYLQKKEKAANTVFELYTNGFFEKNHENGLLKAYQKLEHFRAVSLYLIFFKINRSWFRKNIVSSKPNLLILDLYCLGYFCSLIKK